MWTKLFSLWDTIRGSLWFVPSLMAAGAVLLAFTSLWLDREFIGQHPSGTFAWLYGGGADGAREVLATVASSMITVAGVIFSITVVALTLASQQFGPRLLRNFLRDPGNQIVLGTFISIHLYCLLVLRAVRAEEAGGFVPHLSVSVTLVLALIGAGVLIYFFHHATSSIRASSVIAAVAEELDRAIDRLFPDLVEEPGPPPHSETEPRSPEKGEQGGRAIQALGTGYVQALDTDCLVACAKEARRVIRLHVRPGDFVIRGAVLARVVPADPVSKDVVKTVNGAFVLGEERTVVQDVRFPAQQLAEMAVRALSPGVNDPSTALACIDRLGAGFIRLAARQVPSPYRYDETGELRLIAYPVTLAQMIDDTVGLIREHGRTSSAVTLRLLDMIIAVAPTVRSAEALTALQQHANSIQRGSLRGLPEEGDHDAVQRRLSRVREALARPHAA